MQLMPKTEVFLMIICINVATVLVMSQRVKPGMSHMTAIQKEPVRNADNRVSDWT